MRSARFFAALLVAMPVAVGLQVSPAQAQAASQDAQIDPAKLAIARKIVDIGYPEQDREAMFFDAAKQMSKQVRDAMEKQMDSKDPGAEAILNSWLDEYLEKSRVVMRKHIPSLMDGIAAAYATMFTEQELRDILAFVSTPSGKAFFVRSPKLLAEPHFAAANQAYMQDVYSQLPAAVSDLQERLKAYSTEKAKK